MKCLLSNLAIGPLLGSLCKKKNTIVSLSMVQPVKSMPQLFQGPVAWQKVADQPGTAAPHLKSAG